MALEDTELNMKNNLTILSMADSNEALDGCSFRLERSNLVALPASATASMKMSAMAGRCRKVLM